MAGDPNPDNWDRYRVIDTLTRTELCSRMRQEEADLFADSLNYTLEGRVAVLPNTMDETTPIYDELNESYLGQKIDVEAIMERDRWTFADAVLRTNKAVAKALAEQGIKRSPEGDLVRT